MKKILVLYLGFTLVGASNFLSGTHQEDNRLSSSLTLLNRIKYAGLATQRAKPY